MQTPLHYSLHLWGCLLLAPFLSGPALTLPSNSATMSSLHRGHVRLSISQGSTHILWNSCLQWGGRCSEMKRSLVFPSTHKYALMALTAMYVHQQQQHKPPHISVYHHLNQSSFNNYTSQVYICMYVLQYEQVRAHATHMPHKHACTHTVHTNIHIHMYHTHISSNMDVVVRWREIVQLSVPLPSLF